ncbi:MAG: TonB-dependent receptor plug domain-containing protein, partial [Opitutaceae bacterium]|nr:TonB-dependent receptor plug domain-containing protein [Opitutaceae bacterium]
MTTHDYAVFLSRCLLRNLSALIGILFLGSLVPAPVVAQVAPAERDSTAPKNYDLNNDGRVDAKDDASTRTDGSKGAKTQGTEGSAGSGTVTLSPFEVTESNSGYLATNTMSGTRLNTSLEDLASSISVVTKQQMSDFAMLDINDVFAYEAGAEGADTYTDYEINRRGYITDKVLTDRQSSNRLRGIGAANISRSGFASSGRVPVDPIDIDAIEISRGPNSNLFGLGEGSGTVNMVSASANLNREITTTQVRFDNTDGWRTSFDLSRPLIRGKLAARVSGVYQHDEDPQKPSGMNTRRLNAMIRLQPFKYTTLRASFQSYFSDGTRANTMTPRDGISYWKSLGSPTWDPVTQIATVNGVSTAYTGTNNPVGLANLNRAGPVLFVDQGGIQKWMIGRMPAATATNGPANVAGVNRLLESVPEPIRDGRPLFSTIRAISDPDIYDYAHVNLSAPNYQREEVATSTVEFEQYLLNTDRHTAAVQLAWQREDTDRTRRTTVGSIGPVGTAGYAYVDPNSRLLDGSPNPFYLKPYLGVPEPVWTQTPYEQDSYRAQLAYVLDLTKEKSFWLRLLGRQQVLGYYEERLSKNHVYRYRDVMISDNPIYAPAGQPKGNQLATNGFVASTTATRPYFHYYIGDANGQDIDYAPSRAEPGVYDFTWYNAQTKQWVTDRATFGEAGIAEASAGENAGSVRNLLQTKGVILQSSFFDNRLITTLGFRTDQTGEKRQNRVALKPNGYEFDFDAMDGWRGDWDIRSGDTTTKGAVLRPFRGWKYIEDASRGTGWSAMLATALQGMGFHYNRADSFKPAGPAISILLDELPNPGSVGKDYGITLSLGGKFMFRANHYTTQQLNSRAGQGSNLANRLIDADFDISPNHYVFNLHSQATNWLLQLNPSMTAAQADAEAYRIQGIAPEVFSTWQSNTIGDSTDILAKGEEYELSYNPSNYWTLRANVTRSESIDGPQSPNQTTWLAQRMAVWETIIDPRTGTKWLDTGYTGTLPDPAGRTPRDFINTSVITPLRIEGATQGTSRPQIREWRFNLATSYKLAGISQNRILKNMTVGGGVRYESKGAIGFYGVPINGNIEIAETLDPSRPIWDKAHSYFDAFANYQTRFFGDKVRARFQLNVRN